MRRISEDTKRRQKRGEGEGANYKPYIESREFGSEGTCSNPIDWKNGRSVQLLSQAEDRVWHILRWNDAIQDIREQFPLELERTLAIADEFGVRHPRNRSTAMTTDFVITFTPGNKEKYCAISVKTSRSVLENKRTVEKLTIEKAYWNRRRIPFSLVFAEEINRDLAENIRSVVRFYDLPLRIEDDITILKHLIARKIIEVDLSSGTLYFPNLVKQYEGEINLWKKSHL